VTPVAIALGSNLGDRERTLHAALDALTPSIQFLAASSFHETDPVGVDPGQPPFLNAAAIGRTTLDARALLETLLAVERQFGRVRPYEGAPRTLDLDLILYGNAVLDEPGLVVPHPRFRDRAFVLQPLLEIAPRWTDPVTGFTIAELEERLRGRDDMP
jgi:2-amino-4-hydroxy-6-hydroxymethyldihydropteridine diphosphokinase